MSDISKRLRASVRMDAINGDPMERSVCASQMNEGAGRIEALERELANERACTQAMNDDFHRYQDALRIAEDALAIQASYRNHDQARSQRALDAVRAVLNPANPAESCQESRQSPGEPLTKGHSHVE